MLQDFVGKQDVADAIPRMKGARGTDRDHAAGVNCKGGSDRND